MAKKIFILLLSALCLTACAKTSVSSSDNSADTSSQDVIHETNANEKTYSFPEFLSSSSKADVLSSAVYTSFDSAQLLVEPKEQPFDDYKCTACFNKQYYIFTENDSYGLLDLSGNVLVPSENISKITPVSDNLLKFDYNNGDFAYYLTDESGGEWTPDSFEDFDSSRISFSDNVNDSGEAYHTLCLDGQEIYETQWNEFSKVKPDTLDTSKNYELIYSVVGVSGRYYIAFDKYYNFTVYGAEYGFVSLKAQGEYGECYICTSEDYEELKTLISSFGRESTAHTPSKDEDEDYISITLGLDTDEETIITVSADGYCMTQKQSGDEDKNIYFSVMSSETFVDLINWVSLDLSEEFSG